VLVAGGWWLVAVQVLVGCGNLGMDMSLNLYSNDASP